MRTAAWIAAAVFGLMSLIIIGANYILFFRDILAKRGERIPSMFPFVGGILGFLALQISHLASFPQPRWSGYSWFVPLLDPGCYLLYFSIMPIVWKVRGFGPRGIDNKIARTSRGDARL